MMEIAVQGDTLVVAYRGVSLSRALPPGCAAERLPDYIAEAEYQRDDPWGFLHQCMVEVIRANRRAELARPQHHPARVAG